MRLSLFFGIITIVGLLILGMIYFPLVSQELVQLKRSHSPAPTIESVTPIDTTFSIVIPRIGANSRVIAEVNPFNAKEYQESLALGVAHAKGSALPGQPGNVFLFAHSSVSVFEAQKYNSVFYLLHWLEPGDQIRLFYQDTPYTFRVKAKEKIAAEKIDYMYQFQPAEQLVLMTCWPPGTDWKRLIVVAERI